MPTWLHVALVILGFVAFTALLAAAQMGNWRTAWVAAKQFSTVLLLLALPAILLAVALFIWPPAP